MKEDKQKWIDEQYQDIENPLSSNKSTKSYSTVNALTNNTQVNYNTIQNSNAY